MAETKTESKYAKRLQARWSYGGPSFRSLGNSKEGQEKFLPLPKPFHLDYFPNRIIKNEYAMQKEALNTLLPFEKVETIMKYKKVYSDR